MGASRLWPDREKCKLTILASGLRVEERLTGARGSWLYDLHAPSFPIFLQPIFQSPSWLGHFALNDGPIDFLNSPLSELFSEPGCCLARAREQQHARYRSIQPVDDTEKHLTRFVMFCFQI